MQPSQHTFELGGALGQVRVMLGIDELQIFRQEQVVFQLARRSHGDGAKPGELGISIPSTSFRQIRGDGSAASPQLTGQSLEFFAREDGGDLIDRQGQLV